MKKHEKLVQEVTIHHWRKQNNDFCVFGRATGQALTWMYLESCSTPESGCSAALPTPWYNAVQILPCLCHLGWLPMSTYSLLSWETEPLNSIKPLLWWEIFLSDVTLCPISGPTKFWLLSLPYYVHPANPVQWLYWSLQRCWATVMVTVVRRLRIGKLRAKW